MGILGTILKTAATIGASAIPGVGAVAGPAVGAALAGPSGGGILSRLGQAGTTAGLNYGFDQLNNTFNPQNAGVGAESFADQMTLANPEMLSDPNLLSGNPLRQYAAENFMDAFDRFSQQNSFLDQMGGF